VIEVRYAGAVVAKSAMVRDLDAGGFFLSINEPMPVGTVLDLIVDRAAKFGRVEQVIESPESTLAGMRIRFVDAPAARPPPVVRPAVIVPAAVAAAAPTATEPAAPIAVSTPMPVSDDESAAVDIEAVSGPIETAGGDANPGQGGGGRRRRRRR